VNKAFRAYASCPNRLRATFLVSSGVPAGDPGERSEFAGLGENDEDAVRVSAFLEPSSPCESGRPARGSLPQ